jgi:hypothetical protein
VIEDLKTKLDLFIAVHPNQDSQHLKDLLKEITRNNICCDLLEVYLENPQLIPSIRGNLFEIRKELILNLPMILNDLKDCILRTDQKNLDKLSGNLKSSLFELKRMRQEYRTEYLTTKFFPILRKRVELPLAPIPDENSIAEIFPTTGIERIIADVRELEHRGTPAGFVSDYWKERIQMTIDHAKDLSVPLPKGKYGLNSLSTAVQKQLSNVRANAENRSSGEDEPGNKQKLRVSDPMHIVQLPYLKLR